MSVHSFRRGSDGAGDPRKRFESLVREHHRAIHAHVRVVYPSADGDAVVNAVFTQLWLHLGELPDGAVRAWLRASARHEVFNTVRGEQRWYALGDRVARLDQSRPSSSTIDSRLELDAVMTALSTLPPADRELLLMNAVEDLTPDDLGTILGIQPGAAKQRLSRARARLREAVERLDVLACDREGV